MHKLLATSLLAMVLIDGVIIEDSPVNDVETDVFGPFKAFEKDTSITYRYSLNSSMNYISEELRVINATNGTSYAKYTKASHSAGKSTYSVSFNVSLTKFFGPDGLKFQFSIIRSGEVLNTNTSIIYPSDARTIEVTKDKVKSLVSKEVAFKISNKFTETYHDDFNFVGFKDYIDADNYYSLDLKGNTFLYNRKNLDYSSAKLILLDEKRLFKYLPHDNEGKVSFDLNVDKRDSKLCFKYKDQFYVNPINLDISKYKIPDSIKTNSVYLPINRKKDFLGSQMKIVVNDCGLGKYTLVFDVTYDVFRNLIGSCYDSDYCIKGNVE